MYCCGMRYLIFYYDSALNVENDNKSKENVAEEKQVQTEDKEEKRVQSVPNNVRPGVMRKRSYSFSDGNFRIFRC